MLWCEASRGVDFEQGLNPVAVQSPQAARQLVSVSPHLDDEWFFQKEDWLLGGDPQPHIVVLADWESFVKEAFSFQNATVKQGGTWTDDAQRKTAMIDPSPIFTVDFFGVDPPAPANPDLIGVDHLVLGPAFEFLKLPL